MNFTENHRKYVTTLDRGMAAVYVEGLRAPMLVKVKPVISDTPDESDIPQFKSHPTEDELFDRMALIRLARALSKYADDPDIFKEWIKEFERQIFNFKAISKAISNEECIDFVIKLLSRISRVSPDLIRVCRNLSEVYNNARKKD
jgi:hypothetical protein